MSAIRVPNGIRPVSVDFAHLYPEGLELDALGFDLGCFVLEELLQVGFTLILDIFLGHDLGGRLRFDADRGAPEPGDERQDQGETETLTRCLLVGWRGSAPLGW